MLLPLLFFVLIFATVVTLLRAPSQVFRSEDHPLADRMLELRGGADRTKGSHRRLRQAGYRSEKALAIYLTRIMARSSANPCPSAIANEFDRVTMQVRAGQERSKASAAMVRRTGGDDIKSLSAMILQSWRFGTSLSQAGIKMLFPLLLVFFVVTRVPAVLKTMQDMQLLGW
ncbi:MAG: hypothetical protein ABJC09_05115 [Terriglobia bacterium]